MQILKDNYNKTVKCVNCQSVLNINKNDVNVDKGNGVGICNSTFTCPVCNKTSPIPSNEGRGWAYSLNEIFNE